MNTKIALMTLSLLLSMNCFAVVEIVNPATAESAAALSELAAPEVPAASAETDIKVLKESDIPVQLEPAKKASGEGSLIFRALGSIAIIALLAVGAYLFLGKYRRTQIGKSTAPEIKILRQHYLGPKRSLAIVRVAGESILIGITDSNINMLKSLSLLDEDVPEETPQNFQTVFKKASEPTVTAAPAQAPEDEEDFSISGIRDFVSSRLKNMRNLD